jgi:hypothetical protein
MNWLVPIYSSFIRPNNFIRPLFIILLIGIDHSELWGQQPDDLSADTTQTVADFPADSIGSAEEAIDATDTSGLKKEDKKPKPIELKSTRKYRKILAQITGFISTGYGHYGYRHTLDGFNVVQGPDNTFIFSDTAGLSNNVIDTAYFDWVVAPKVRTGLNLNDTSTVLGADTVQVKYRGTGYSIPINFGLYYHYRQFRMGFGGSFEIHRIRALKPVGFENQLGNLRQTENKLSFFRYYLLLGYTYDKYRYFDFTAEMLLGNMRYGGDFDRSVISGGFFFNLGLKVERHFSEILGVYVKPSVDFKGYRMAVGNAGEIRHRQPAVNTQYFREMSFYF